MGENCPSIEMPSTTGWIKYCLASSCNFFKFFAYVSTHLFFTIFAKGLV